MAKISKMLPCVLVAISTFQAMIRAQAFSRAVGTEGQSPPPDFGRYVNTFPIRGCILRPPDYYSPPPRIFRLSDGPVQFQTRLKNLQLNKASKNLKLA